MLEQPSKHLGGVAPLTPWLTPPAASVFFRSRHRCVNRNGVPAVSFLRTVVMNLLRRGGYRSIRQGIR
jgi:hypothetical protein